MEGGSEEEEQRTTERVKRGERNARSFDTFLLQPATRDAVAMAIGEGRAPMGTELLPDWLASSSRSVTSDSVFNK